MSFQTAHGAHPSSAAEATPFSVTGCALRFWVASLAGFVSHGWILAGSAARALAETEPFPWAGEAVASGLELGVLEAIVLGGPTAVLFALSMRSSCMRAWPGALAIGAGLSAAVCLVLDFWARAAVDSGWARLTSLHLLLGGVAVVAGALAAQVTLRPARG